MPQAREWLAKVTSFAFPRSFAVGKPPMAKDYPDLEAHLDAAAEYAAKEHHVCFTVQITDGTKHAVGREVEIQVPAAEAMKLGQQMTRVATALLATSGKSEKRGHRMTDQTPDTFAVADCPYGEGRNSGSGCIKPSGHDGPHVVTPGVAPEDDLWRSDRATEK